MLTTGRVSLVDLQQLLNVDYSHIEAKVNDMVKHDGHLTLVLGQLIDNSYRQLLAQEIDDQLQEKGHVTIIDLAKTYDLPADFLREVCCCQSCCKYSFCMCVHFIIVQLLLSS